MYNNDMKKIILILLVFVNIIFSANAEPNYKYNVYNPYELNNKPLKTDNLKDASKVMFIMDFSNSMNDKIEGATKLEIALNTLSRILPQIPQGVQTGLRVYGHRGGFTYADGCRASKLAVPLGTNNSTSILNSLYKTSAVGWTPITYSLKQAIYSDFAGIEGKKHIVLLTDGGENCDESPCTFAIELMKTRDDISIDVIAFAFGYSDQDAINQLRCTALTTSGKIYTPNSKEELFNSLFESLNIDKSVQATIRPSN